MIVASPLYTAFHLHICQYLTLLPRPSALLTSLTLHSLTLAFVSSPPLRTLQIQHTRAVRRGASWTAAYHLQLMVAAVARPVRSSMVPSESLLLSVLVVARPDGVCPAEPPVGIQRSGVVAAVDTARTPAMASVAGPRPACGVHPSGFVVRDPAVQPPGVQPVQCPARPVSSRLVSAPVRTRPSPPNSCGGIGDQIAAAGTCHHRNGSRSLWLPRPQAARSTAEGAWTRATLPSRALVSGGRWRTRAG
jgi:hypothetical protein